ncbi:hypothetical protein ACVW0I_001237 [Bradyrhizobium sp. LM6.11]
MNLSAAWAKVEAFDCAALVRPGQRVGAVADGGKRRGGRPGAAGHRIGGALELANHRSQLEFQQFQDFLGGIALNGRSGLGIDRLRSLRGCRRRSHVRQTLPK